MASSMLTLMCESSPSAMQIDGDQIVPLKKLVKVGNSYAIILPKDWVVLKAERDEDDTYWATVKYDGSTFVIGGTR